MKQEENKSITAEQFARLANNFYTQRDINISVDRIGLDLELTNYIFSKEALDLVKKTNKVALVFICLNTKYWQYASEMVQGAKNLFLPGHDTHFFFWTDIPQDEKEIEDKIKNEFKSFGVDVENPESVNNTIIMGSTPLNIRKIITDTQNLIKTPGINIIPTDPQPWPMPTLIRYHLFLQQEEKLKEYDYVYYLDVDMQFCNVVGDEIFGNIMAAQHPMYALRKQYFPPYEPNPESSSYIPRPGKIAVEDGKPRFVPLYFAGGFQGGKSDYFIKAMKDMTEMIDQDLMKNYIPIWNDESVWNKYLFNNEPDVVLTPSYIYPDSLIKEYYEPLWGCSYTPKIKTLTKWFNLSKQGGDNIQKVIKETKNLQ